MTNEELSIKLTEVDQRGKSNTDRINKLEQSTAALNELTTAVKVMVTKQDYIADKVDGLDAKVTDLEKKPGKRWDGLVEKIVWAVAAAVVGFLLAQIGVT